MPESIASPTIPDSGSSAARDLLSQVSTVELAQTLVERLSISDRDWHRLKGDRKARAREQAAVALVLLLKEQPEEGLARLQQAVGWLDRSISAPACPTHGHRSDPA